MLALRIAAYKPANTLQDGHHAVTYELHVLELCFINSSSCSQAVETLMLWQLGKTDLDPSGSRFLFFLLSRSPIGLKRKLCMPLSFIA